MNLYEVAVQKTALGYYPERAYFIVMADSAGRAKAILESILSSGEFVATVVHKPGCVVRVRQPAKETRHRCKDPDYCLPCLFEANLDGSAVIWD
jgi:hypothetical protein